MAYLPIYLYVGIGLRCKLFGVSHSKLVVSKERELAILARHMPIESVESVFNLIKKHKVHFKITRERHSKLGDYRSPTTQRGHVITINHNLNHYSFLITVIHEFAHLYTWEKYKNKVKPHGKEWKAFFQLLMQEYLEKPIFPDDLKLAINNYMSNPAASSCTDHGLYVALKKYDPEGSSLLLQDLEKGDFFLIQSKRMFQKGELRRKRYLCREIKTNRLFLISALAEVEKIKDNQ